MPPHTHTIGGTMYWNRRDIVEAWYLALGHCHTGQRSWGYARLCKMGEYFEPSPLLCLDSLSENGAAIYWAARRQLLAAQGWSVDDTEVAR